MEKAISEKACEPAKTESDGISVELMGDLTKRILYVHSKLCDLSELCERIKINRCIH
jgi:hypothetical protein